MKEIKFRGRDIRYNKFIFSNSIAFEKIGGLNGYQPYLRDENGDWVRCYPESIAQLVGYDADGREVYEDDVLVNGSGGEFKASLNGIITSMSNPCYCRYLERLSHRKYYRLKECGE